MKYFDAFLRYIRENDYTHREDVAIIISEIFEMNPDITFDKFKKQIKDIRRDFFRINNIDRNEFAEIVFDLFKRIRKARPKALTTFDTAKGFMTKHLEVGFDTTKFIIKRTNILERFSIIKKPHTVIMKAFNQLLDKIKVSYSVNLHGVKEYSGIDIVKKIDKALVGFQIKSRYDNISEHIIRSETSKALDWKINGFVLVYAREINKSVESSIQAAYHHFKNLNDSEKMYCTIVYPELLSELFRINSINI